MADRCSCNDCNIVYNLNLVDVVELSPCQTIFFNMDLMLLFFLLPCGLSRVQFHTLYSTFSVFFSMSFLVEPRFLALDSLIHTT